MAISTNDAVDTYGTQDTITTGTPGAITTGSFSAAADCADWVNDDDATEGAFVLKCQWGTVTSIGDKPINLFARLNDIDSTNDPKDPGTTNHSIYLGSFNAPGSASASTDVYIPGRFPLPNFYTSQSYRFFLENLTGQTISSGWSLKVTPIAQGPK